MDVRIAQVFDLPEGLDLLERESVDQDFTMVRRLRTEWEAGSKRFASKGERLLGAYRGERLIGICGLSHDPYIEDESVGRIRHLYVLDAERLSGVGRRLVEELLGHARQQFRLVRLSTARASAFYERLGFIPTDEYKVTHLMPITCDHDEAQTAQDF